MPEGNAAGLVLTTSALGFFLGISFTSWVHNETFGVVFGGLCAAICAAGAIAVWVEARRGPRP